MGLTINEEKYLKLASRFARHEQWVQSGCPEAVLPEDPVPGYTVLSHENPLAYGLYRDSLLIFFAQFHGNRQIFSELDKLINNNEKQHAKEMESFWQAHREPTDKFRVQWGNLFYPYITTSLTPENCFKYQQKYEVEFPLITLAQLGLITAKGIFDQTLTRFQDRAGKHKKGVLVDYILMQLRPYPNLFRVLEWAYNPRLRNTIGHNEYQIVSDEIKSIDGNIKVTKVEFFRGLLALQDVQNAVLWLMVRQRVPNIELAKCGIHSIGFGEYQSEGLSTLEVFQLEPFRSLDEQAKWLTDIYFEMLHPGKVRYSLASTTMREGPTNEKVLAWLKVAQERNKVLCIFRSTMPCVHNEEHYIDTPLGEYCEQGPAFHTTVPVEVVGI